MGRRAAFLLSCFMAACCLSYAQQHHHEHHSHSNGSLAFIANKGQFHSNVRYKAEVSAGNLYLEDDRLVYNLWDKSLFARMHSHKEEIDLSKEKFRGHNFHVYFKGSQKASIQAMHKLDQWHNYFLGQNRSKWATEVPLYQSLEYEDLYPGIDLRVVSEFESIKYEFVLENGANPNSIQLAYEGVDGLKVKDEELIVKLSIGEMIESAPYAYQWINGKKEEVKCSFQVLGNSVSFKIGNYSKDHPLVIDPTLIFSTYSGSRADNFGYTATFDSEGFLYAGGTAFSNGYDTTRGAFQTTWANNSVRGGTDIVITKYDSTGRSMIYSTYLGGSGDEQPHSLVVNSRDELYMYGTSGSTDYPVALNAYQANLRNPSTANNAVLTGTGIQFDRGCDIVVTKFNSTGTGLRGSTYIGGSNNDGLNNYRTPYVTRYNYADENRGEIDIDSRDFVYIVTSTLSTDFPMVGNTFDRTYGGGFQDGVIIKMTTDLNAVVWSSYLGGQNHDAIYSLAIDRNDDIVVAGGTSSPGYFGRTNSVFPAINGGRTDGFITHIKSDGTQIINTTYFGTGQYDQTYFVELDKRGNKYVVGQTEDLTGALVRNATYRVPSAGQFVSKLSPGLDTLLWSTRFGVPITSGTISRPSLSPTAFLVDLCQSVYISGWGGNTNTFGTSNNTILMNGMDTTSDGFQKTTDGSDFYMFVMSDNAASLEYASFFGGQADEHVDGGTSRFDKKGKMYQSVCADCGVNNPARPFPTTSGVWSRIKGSGAACNNAVFKMDFLLPAVVAEFQIPINVCVNDSFEIDNFSKKLQATRFLWLFGNGDTSTLEDPGKYAYDSAGVYQIFLILSDTNSCNSFDTLSKVINVLAPNSNNYQNDSLCIGDTIQIGFFQPPGYTSTWIPDTSLSSGTVNRPLAFPTEPTHYIQLLETGICVDTWRLFLQVDSLIDAAYSIDDSVCIPDQRKISNSSTLNSSSTYRWDMGVLDTSTAFEPLVSVDSVGRFFIKLVVEDSLSCNKKDSVVRVIEGKKDTAFNLSPMLSCNNAPVSIGLSAQSGYSYFWNTSQGLADSNSSLTQAQPKTDTTYWLHIDKGVCVDTAYQRVEKDTISAETEDRKDVCSFAKITDLSGSSFGLSNQFTWSSLRDFSVPIPPSKNDSTITVDPPDFANTYYFRAVSSRGCESIDSSIVYVSDYGIHTDTTQRKCLKDTIGIKVFSDVPGDELTAIWNPFKDIITPNDTTHILVAPKETMTYVVEAVNKIGCRKKDSVTVNVSTFNPDSAIITASRDTIISIWTSQLNTLPSGFAYEWTPSTGLSDPQAADPIARPLETTDYTVRVYDPEYPQCEITTSKRIYVDEVFCVEPYIYLPNSFTPNSDGLNDVLLLRGKYVDEMQLIIYNRWGERVFESTNQSDGWDGTFEGNPVNADVFAYYLKVRCLGGEEFEKKGDITIIK